MPTFAKTSTMHWSPFLLFSKFFFTLSLFFFLSLSVAFERKLFASLSAIRTHTHSLEKINKNRAHELKVGLPLNLCHHRKIAQISTNVKVNLFLLALPFQTFFRHPHKLRCEKFSERKSVKTVKKHVLNCAHLDIQLHLDEDRIVFGGD